MADFFVVFSNSKAETSWDKDVVTQSRKFYEDLAVMQGVQKPDRVDLHGIHHRVVRETYEKPWGSGG